MRKLFGETASCVIDQKNMCPMREDSFLEGQIAWIILFFLNLWLIYLCLLGIRGYFNQPPELRGLKETSLRINSLILVSALRKMIYPHSFICVF